MFKIDSGGAIQWEKTYGGTVREDAQPILATHDGGSLAAGGTYTYLPPPAGGEDAWLVKLDVNGNIQWQRAYGGAGDDEVWSVDETFDGYIVAAVTASFGAGGKDVWILKLDFSGNIPDCEPTRTTDAAMTTTQATVGEQELTVSSIASQVPTHAAITDTSAAPVVQCFGVEAVPVGGVIEVEGPKQLMSWLGLIGLVALGLVALAFKRRRNEQQ